MIYIYYIYTQLYTITNIFTSSVYMHHTLSYNICIYTEQHLEQKCDVIHIISYINVNVHQIYTCIISYLYIYHHISTVHHSTSKQKQHVPSPGLSKPSPSPSPSQRLAVQAVGRTTPGAMPCHGAFLSHGATPLAERFISWEIPWNMDDH